jgi:hypothetical protein
MDVQFNTELRRENRGKNYIEILEYEKEKWKNVVQTESLETEKHTERQEKRKMTFTKTRGETGTNTVEMCINTNMEETF